MKKLVLGLGAAALSVISLGAPPALASSGAVVCNKTFTGVTINSNLQVPANDVCVLKSSTVKGDVTVGSGGYFEAVQSTVTGDLTAQSALTVYLHGGSLVGGNLGLYKTAQLFIYDSKVSHDTGDATAYFPGYGHVQICNSTIGGNLGVAQVGPDVLIGDPAASCGGNKIPMGDVGIAQNSTSAELYVIGNTVNGDMSVSNNTGTSDKLVQNDSGKGNLSCSGNAAPFTGSPNGTWGGFSGQCGR